MKDDFVRKIARKIPIRDQVVYMALSSHANKYGITRVGCRTLSEELGINKDTVTRAVKSLIVSGLVRRLDSEIRGQVSVLQLISVPFDASQVSDSVRPKEYKKEFKELIKEKSCKKSVCINYEPEPVKEILGERRRQVLENLRQNLISKGIYRERPKNS